MKENFPNEGEFLRLFHFAGPHLGKAIRVLEQDPKRRLESIVAAFNPWDETSMALYRDLREVNGNKLPVNPTGSVPVVGFKYDDFMALAGQYYDVAGHEGERKQLEPNQICIPLFANGSLSSSAR